MNALPLWIKLLGGISLLAAACVGLSFVPTGKVAYAPTPPIDLEGKIRIDGRMAEPLQGHMYLVGVTERRVNLLQRVLLDVTDPSVDFDTAPEGSTEGTPRARDVDAMAQAKAVAAGVGLDVAGKVVNWDGNGAVVDTVIRGTPAAKSLRAGDVITEVNGVAVDSAVDVTEAIRDAAPGTLVTLGLNRAGSVQRVSMRTIPPQEGSDSIYRSRLGMSMSTLGLKVGLPFSIGIDSGEVVGPSAGLAFALYIFDSISPVDLLHGRHVVASGALAPDGQVLPVGRMRQKVIAAQEANRDILVVPFANGEEASRAVKDACPDGGGCLMVLPVRSAQEAIDLLKLDDATLQSRIAS